MKKTVLTAAGAAVVAVSLLWLGTVPEMPSFQAVVESYRRSDALLLDRQGEVLQEIRTDLEGRRLEWTPLEEVSPRLLELLIFSEDRDFHSHGGVDWGALAAAAWGSVFEDGRRGASTLTMQLASLLDERLRPSGVYRSRYQKWRQIRAARALESTWSKEQILEAYLNLVSFRGELQGVAAASRGLFGRAPHGLDSAQAALLTALLRAPNASADDVLRRARGLTAAVGGDVQFPDPVAGVLEGGYHLPPRARWAPHVARRLLGDFPGGRIEQTSTLEAGLQRFALQRLQEQLRRLGGRNVGDGAILAVDNASGEVLAYLGNGGELSSAIYVDGVQARRQAGSTLKPFLYARALERRLITPATPINDEPLELAVTGGVYRPSNYDNRFHGLVSARVALASSLNIPAVRVLTLVGEQSFVSLLGELGFTHLRDAQFYGPALALGTADVSLWEQVAAYRALATGGLWSPLTLKPGEPGESRRVFSEEAAFLVSDILSDRESRSLTFGLENVLSTSYWSAVKTGTSKDMRDNWCVGYSSEFTVGVWVGNFSGEPMYDVSGISGAGPLWLETMDYLHRNRPSRPPEPPSGLVAAQTRTPSGDAGRREWFERGTEDERPRAVTPQASPRIVYPPHEAILALDPDIPHSRQRVFFEASVGGGGMRWKLNGKDLGPAAATPWQPVAGAHRLELVDSGGRHLDGVQFVVR